MEQQDVKAQKRKPTGRPRKYEKGKEPYADFKRVRGKHPGTVSLYNGKPPKPNRFPVKASDKEVMKQVSEDVETNIIDMDMELFRLPAIDRTDAEEVAKRFDEYVAITRKYSMKTSVEGFCLALGFRVTDLRDLLSSGQVSLSTRQEYKKILGYLGSDLWANAQAGKTNPVVAIFLSKNHFGYKDQTEQKVTIENVTGSAESAREKYLADPEVIDARESTAEPKAIEAPKEAPAVQGDGETAKEAVYTSSKDGETR